MSESGDYISREEAAEMLSQPITMSMCLSVEECNNKIAQQRIDRYLVENIPAADVVEVVRCKDCKYSEHWYRDKRLCRLWYGEEKPSAPIDVFDDGFCNYGERREDDV